MDDIETQDILKIYPEYNRVTGPSYANDGRARIGLKNTLTGEKTVRQLAKVRLEVSLGRKLTGSETVDHIDENKTNDSSSNLQVLSRSENSSKGALGNKHCLGLVKKDEIREKTRGGNNGMAIITNEEAKTYRENFFSKQMTRLDIEEKSKMSDRSVRNLLKGVSFPTAGGPLISVIKKGGRSKNT